MVQIPCFTLCPCGPRLVTLVWAHCPSHLTICRMNVQEKEPEAFFSKFIHHLLVGLSLEKFESFRFDQIMNHSFTLMSSRGKELVRGFFFRGLYPTRVPLGPSPGDETQGQGDNVLLLASWRRRFRTRRSHHTTPMYMSITMTVYL